MKMRAMKWKASIFSRNFNFCLMGKIEEEGYLSSWVCFEHMHNINIYKKNKVAFEYSVLSLV